MAQNYYPGGMLMPGRTFSSNNYRFGFNGKEKDDNITGVTGSHLDFGARIYDSRIGRWLSVDQLSYKYPGHSPYNFAQNTPISAIDPDGRLVIFIGGLRLWHGNEQDANQKGGQIHTSDVYDYWSAPFNNMHEYHIDIAGEFLKNIGDYNAYYTSGSSQWNSSASQRFDEGKIKAQRFHAMVQSGEIKLASDETIKIVSHSQGGAHAAGFATELMSYKDENGNPLYNIEVMYYITPHQPKDIEHPEGVLGKQYSHPNDYVASDSPWWMPNGGTEMGPIPGISVYDNRDILPGEENYNSEIRGGHNVEDNTFILDIPKNEKGAVEPRKDKPKN